MDWHEVNFYIDEIGKEERERRRWGLMESLAGSLAGGAQSPEAAKSAFEYWQGLMDARTTQAERAAMVEAEEEEQWRLLEEQRRERADEARARNQSRIISGM